MIYSILSECWKHDVFLTVVDGQLLADYKKGTFPDELRFKVQQYKTLLTERVKQNQLLKGEKWFVGCFGDVYEYRLGFKSYLYIERESEQAFTLWRRTQREIGEDKTKIFLSSASFEQVYKKAASYINWWTGKQERAVM